MLIRLFCLLLPFCLTAESLFFTIERENAQNKINKKVSRPKKPDDFNQFKTALSLLVWQTNEEGLEFASKESALSSVHFSWDPGFKLLLGYHFAESLWDLNVRWTWEYSRSHRSLHGERLSPLWIPPQAAIANPPTYANAKATLLLLLNCVDIELIGTQKFSRHFALKAHGGLKGAVINQTYRVKYTGGLFDGTNQMLDSDAHAKTKGQGLGPRIGFHSEWYLPHHLALIADLAGAFTLSSVTTQRIDYSIGIASSVVQQIATHVHENFWIWRPILEVKTGVSWSHLFRKKERLKLEFAYEIQQYWEQNMLIRYANPALFYPVFKNQGNLTLQGFSLTADIGF